MSSLQVALFDALAPTVHVTHRKTYQASYSYNLYVSLGEKSGFPKMETTSNRDISCFPVVSIFGKPLCGFHQVSTLGNSQLDDSTQIPCIGNLGVNLTSGFHEFPQLETINPIIPPHFLALEISGKPHRRFPRVSTSFHTSKQSTQIHCMEN